MADMRQNLKCSIGDLAYHRCRHFLDTLNIPKHIPDLRYGIRYLNSTRISGIQDITGFNLLKSLTSGRIKLFKMRLELVSMRRILHFLQIPVSCT